MKRALLAFFCVSSSVYANAILVTNPASINTSGIVNWAQLGPDTSSMSPTFHVTSTGGDYLSVHLAGGVGSVDTACASGCTYKPTATMAANDSVLQAGDATDAGAPITMSMYRPISAAGSYIQAVTSQGTPAKQFTAHIQVFAYGTTVLDATRTSDLAGDAIFLGVSDTSAEITRVIFSLTDANGNVSSSNFILDRLYLQNSLVIPPTQLSPLATGVPEPGAGGLVASALLALGFGLKRKLFRL